MHSSILHENNPQANHTKMQSTSNVGADLAIVKFLTGTMSFYERIGGIPEDLGNDWCLTSLKPCQCATLANVFTCSCCGMPRRSRSPAHSLTGPIKNLRAAGARSTKLESLWIRAATLSQGMTTKHLVQSMLQTVVNLEVNEFITALERWIQDLVFKL